MPSSQRLRVAARPQQIGDVRRPPGLSTRGLGHRLQAVTEVSHVAFVDVVDGKAADHQTETGIWKRHRQHVACSQLGAVVDPFGSQVGFGNLGLLPDWSSVRHRSRPVTSYLVSSERSDAIKQPGRGPASWLSRPSEPGAV